MNFLCQEAEKSVKSTDFAYFYVLRKAVFALFVTIRWIIRFTKVHKKYRKNIFTLSKHYFFLVFTGFFACVKFFMLYFCIVYFFSHFVYNLYFSLFYPIFRHFFKTKKEAKSHIFHCEILPNTYSKFLCFAHSLKSPFFCVFRHSRQISPPKRSLSSK